MATSDISLGETGAIAWRRYYDLTKPKVVALILFTALVYCFDAVFNVFLLVFFTARFWRTIYNNINLF